MQPTTQTLAFRVASNIRLNHFKVETLIRETGDGAIPLRKLEQTGRTIVQAQLNPAFSLAQTLENHPDLFQKPLFLNDLLAAITSSLEQLAQCGLDVELNLLTDQTVEIYDTSIGLSCRLLCLPLSSKDLQLPAMFMNALHLKKFLCEQIVLHRRKEQKNWRDLVSNWWDALTVEDYARAIEIVREAAPTAAKPSRIISQKRAKTNTSSLSKNSHAGRKSEFKLKTRVEELKLLQQIKQKLKKSDLPFERTIPLSPAQADYRVALISEYQPGSAKEDLGTRAFILVDEFLIGRDRFVCDMVLEDLSISRRHARILRYGQNFYIEDLGSDNSTYVDGNRLNKFQEFLLEDHCKLKFADLTFFFSVDS